MIVLQATVERAVELGAQLVGLAVLAGIVAALAATVYRFAVRDPIPAPIALLFGLGAVAAYLNAAVLLEGVAAGGAAFSAEMHVALFNIGAFLFGGFGAVAGRRIGDRFGADVLVDRRSADTDSSVGRLAETVGRAVTVELPTDIGAVVGYDPVTERTEAELAGRTFVFPTGLSEAELEERFADRLRTDYGVGTVDVDLAADGTVEYLAVGSRPAGIGPTLPPATNAVAIQADPAFAASTGDVVQVWETDPMRRVLTGELRGIAADVVTVAIDSGDTPKLDPRTQYRLVTLPVDDRPEREFASVLRAADESFATATVEAGSPLHGMAVGALSVTVVSVEQEDGHPVALPERTHVLAPGDRVHAIAHPDALRRLETAGEALDPTLVSTGTDATADDSALSTGGEGETSSKTADEMTANGTDGIPGKADASTFQDLKAEFESAEGGIDATADAESSGDGIEVDAGMDGGATAEADADRAPTAEAETDETTEETDSVTIDGSQADDSGGATSFQDLKAEFESGEADWDLEEGDEDSSDAADTVSENGESDEVVPLDDADIEFGDEEGAFGDDAGEEDSTDGGGDDLDPLGEFDEEGDDIFSDDSGDLLEAEDDDIGSDDGEEVDIYSDDAEADNSFSDGDSGLFDEGSDDIFRDESEDLLGEDDESSQDDTEGAGGEGSADADSDDSESGGGTSFAQLKEEFESGDADWEDEVSDSPGGDMRLDE